MNKLVLASLVAALSGVFAAPKPAHAGGDEVAAAIGGFIGGVIVGSSIERGHDRDRGYDRDDGVRVSGHIEIGHGHRHDRRGHWEWTRVRVWVPGRWIVSHDRHGHRTRYFERGRYEWRRERVWVSHGRGHRR